MDTEENDVDDEILSGSNRERRRSFLESNSFTKPNLKHTDTPNKECINKPTKNTVEKPELFLGLKIGELQKLYSKADSLKQLILKTTTGISDKVLHGQVTEHFIFLMKSRIHPSLICILKLLFSFAGDFCGCGFCDSTD